MLKKIVSLYKHLDKKICKIMKYGLIFCSILGIFSTLILLIYSFTFPSPFFYYIGIDLLKLSLIFAIEFIICGFIVDGIKKEFV